MNLRRRTTTPEEHAQAIFLGRLQRLIRVRSEYLASGDLNAYGVKLLDRAIDATYRDCIDYGAADAARPIMAAHRRRMWEGRDV